MEKKEERESVVLLNEGKKMFGILHRPSGSGPFPCVLICHGLAGNKIGRYRLYVHLSERLSALGIASFRVDFRGSGDSEGEFSDTTLESEVSDAIVALNYLHSRPDIDHARQGLFGRSVGGTVAFMTAKQTKTIKSLAVWAPIYSGEQWESQWKMLQDPLLDEEFRLEKMKVNGQVPGVKFFEQLFTMRMEECLKELDTLPLLHIHGEQDLIVTPLHADNYIKARQDLLDKNKFIRLPESDHDFSHTKEQTFALDETARWFLTTL